MKNTSFAKGPPLAITMEYVKSLKETQTFINLWNKIDKGITKRLEYIHVDVYFA